MTNEPGADTQRTTPGTNDLADFTLILEGQRHRELLGFAPGREPSIAPEGVRYEFRFATTLTVVASVMGLILAAGVDAHRLPRLEKVAWEYAFEFDDIPCRLRHGRSGLRLTIWLPTSDPQQAEHVGTQVTSRLTRATTRLDQEVVQPRVRAEIDANRAEVANQYFRYRGMVDFFTRLLDEARGAGPAEPDVDSADPLAGVLSTVGSVMEVRKHERELAYLATALLASYFAYVQHVLVLLSGFSTEALAPDFSVRALIRARWAEQFNTAFPPPHSGVIGRAKTDLEHLASTYRNPLLHGGGHAVDGMAVEWAPGWRAMVSENGQHTDQFMLWQPALTDTQIDDVLKRIHDVDAALRKHPFFAWIEDGVPVRFDPLSVQKAVEAEARGAADELIEWASRSFDRVVNWET